MRGRDRQKTPWVIRYSPIFERAFYRIEAHTGAIWDILNSFEDAAVVNPRAIGEPHLGFPEKEMWVYESPPLARLPMVYVLYEIDEDAGVVILWSLRLQ